MTEISVGQSPAHSTVLKSPELLSLILGYLEQGDLLRLQRVSRRWASIIKTTPSIRATTFSSSGPPRTQNSTTTHGGTPVQRPRLNTFVINRLRWSPALDTDLINTSQFRSVDGNHALEAMADENASWRTQLLTWPPVERIAVTHGTISQEEPSFRYLHLVCPRDGEEVALEEEGEEEEEEDEEEEYDEESETQPPLVLSVLDFPHNQGKECIGVTVMDLLYGLRMHYLDQEYMLEHFIGPHFENVAGGELLVGFERGGPLLTLDVTFAAF